MNHLVTGFSLKKKSTQQLLFIQNTLYLIKITLTTIPVWLHTSTTNFTCTDLFFLYTEIPVNTKIHVNIHSFSKLILARKKKLYSTFEGTKLYYIVSQLLFGNCPRLKYGTVFTNETLSNSNHHNFKGATPQKEKIRITTLQLKENHTPSLLFAFQWSV